MATETTSDPATSASPLRALIVAELTAIKARVAKAASKEEKRVMDSQFGQRMEHLEARIKEIADAATAEGTTPATE